MARLMVHRIASHAPTSASSMEEGSISRKFRGCFLFSLQRSNRTPGFSQFAPAAMGNEESGHRDRGPVLRRLNAGLQMKPSSRTAPSSNRSAPYISRLSLLSPLQPPHPMQLFSVPCCRATCSCRLATCSPDQHHLVSSRSPILTSRRQQSGGGGLDRTLTHPEFPALKSFHDGY